MNFRISPLFLFNFIFCGISGTSTFYEDSIQFSYDCSVKFDYPRNFDCACISGLWKFYGNTCRDVRLVGGENQYCFHTSNSQLTQAIRILKDKNELIVQKSNGEFSPISGNPIKSVVLSPNDLIITGSEWLFLGESGRALCFKPRLNSYCFFAPTTSGLQTFSAITHGCSGVEHVLVEPVQCVDIHKETKNICRHRMVKRETHQRGKGRSFFGGPGQNLIIFNQTANLPENSPIIYDEDYSPINSSADGNTTKGGISDAIASEIWNFLEAKLDDILGLKVADNDTLETAWTSTSDVQNKPNRRRRGALWGKKSSTAKKSSLVKLKTEQNIQTLKPYKSPLYQFLELAKELMKRTCPAGYVNPDFFDLAVSTFIKIQNKHLRFPESAKNVKAKTRIVESLQSCIENATEFNFTIDPCSEKALHIWPVSGLYCAFGNCSLEINMYGGFENYEPIVETTWQIFKNAHSYCFDHFSKYYNDHHRFTTWMINLFQNPINDIWRNGTATGIVYGGVFGNQENVQTAVAYCAASSQLLSKYPWDLPRPEKIEELSNPATRKKRQVFEQGYDKSAKCLPSHEIPICE